MYIYYVNCLKLMITKALNSTAAGVRLLGSSRSFYFLQQKEEKETN